ncbi:MAG: hypothetical protein ABL888_15695 [Pirellulaceae bacterium]
MPHDSQPLRSTPQSRLQWTTVFSVIAILAIGVANMTNNVADTDLWGHVQYGREVLADGRLPSTSTWTYAAEGTPWINHENLAELWLAYTVDHFGVWGLTVSKLLMGLAIVGLMIWSGRRAGAGWIAIAFSVFVATDLLYMHWHFRPQVLTYLALAILLASWQYVFANWNDVLSGDQAALKMFRQRQRWLWTLPLLFCLWANAHGGFAAGLMIMAVYHAVRFLELGVSTRWKIRWPLVELLLIGASCVLATLVNPYGFKLWEFMWMALRLPRTEITDFKPLSLMSSEAMMVLVAVVLVGIALISSKRRKDLAQLLLLGLILWQGLAHIRHVVIFAILCGFWLPGYLQQLVDLLKQRVNFESLAFSSRRARRVLVAGLCGVTLVCSIRILPQLRMVEVDRNFYPVSALEFMENHNLQGKTLVTFNWAQYVLGYYATKQNGLVAIDGRYETCYPRTMIDQYFDFLFGEPDSSKRYRSPLTPDYDPDWALKHKQPELVLIERNSFGNKVLEKHGEDWVLLYRDSLAQIWGRREKYDHPESLHYVPVAARQTGDLAQTGKVQWPAFPDAKPRKASAEQFVSSHD